jgi:Alginate export
MRTILLLAVLGTQSLQAQQPPPPPKPAEVQDLRAWLSQGKFGLDYRLRYEFVEDDSFAQDAKALSLRMRHGFRTASFHQWSAYLEAESVFALKEDYNSTANRRTQFPVVVDPDGSEINQAYLAYGLNTPTQFILGRQRIAYDNQRFFGNVGFRQNEQTFDAASMVLARNAFSFKAAHLDEVHRIFGNSNPNPLLRQQDLDAVLLNLAYTAPATAEKALAGGVLSGYGYFVKNQDVPLSSSRTLGIRYNGGLAFGEAKRFTYTAEYAQQDDYRGGSDAIDAYYSLIELGLVLDGGRYSIRGAQETLSGDGRYAFQTPFASGHAFNGWADRFLTTPNSGLRDRYLDAGAKLGPGVLSAQWHIYDADQGNARLGKEHGFQYAYQFNDRLFFTLKAANYSAKSFSTDSKKFWLFADYRY